MNKIVSICILIIMIQGGMIASEKQPIVPVKLTMEIHDSLNKKAPEGYKPLGSHDDESLEMDEETSCCSWLQKMLDKQGVSKVESCQYEE